MNDFTIPLVTVTFLAAGIVKGVTGMGLPTLAMGILGALLSPLAAASLLNVLSMDTNLWQLLAGPRIGALARRLWPTMAASTEGTLATAPLLAGGNGGATTTVLGATLAAYALYTLLAPPFRVSPAQERWLSPLVGLITGVIAGTTSVFVIPAVPYMQVLGLEKDDLVQALGMSFTTSTIALALGLTSHQAWQVDQLALSALAVVSALIGMCAADPAPRRQFRHLPTLVPDHAHPAGSRDAAARHGVKRRKVQVDETLIALPCRRNAAPIRMCVGAGSPTPT